MNESVPTPQQEPEPKQSANEKTDKPDKIIIENQPISISIPSKGIRWGAIVEWVLVVITIVLAIYTIKTAIYAGDQAKAAIDAVNLARDQFNYGKEQDAINAIKQDRKDFLRDSLNIASFKLVNRSYLNTLGMKSFNLKVGEPIVYSMLFINTGKTPAYKIQAMSQWKTGTGIYPHEIKIIETQVLDPVEFIIGGGQTQEITFGNTSEKGKVSHVFRSQDSMAVFSKTYPLFVFGKLAYKDKFGESHFTRFAYVYDVKSGNFYGYKHYNEAD